MPAVKHRGRFSEWLSVSRQKRENQYNQQEHRKPSPGQISSRALGYALFDLALFNVFLLFMGDRPAKLIMNGFVIVFNYLASRYVIFTKKRGKGKRQAHPEGDEASRQPNEAGKFQASTVNAEIDPAELRNRGDGEVVSGGVPPPDPR